MNVHSQIVTLNDENFHELVLNQKTLCLVDFWADWCGPCRTMGPFIDRLAAEFTGDIRVAKLNVDENPKTANDLQIRSLPTLILFHGEEIIFEIVGTPNPQSLIDQMEKAIETHGKN